jgi:hypothetical protein
LSTLAIEGSSRAGGGGGPLTLALRYGDLALLAFALPIFVAAGWPLLGYSVAAAVWLVQRGIEFGANRYGALAVATLGRVWLVALVILLVGLAERESGLAAAILTAVLVTVRLGGRFLDRLLHPEAAG